MARKTVDVAVIIPDASPVLTLARIGRLDLLDRFNVQIHIVDQVYFEITKPEHDPKGAIKAALDRMHNTVQIVETYVGTGFAVKLKLNPAISGRNLGEAAVSEYAVRLRKTNGPSFVPLVLYEDPDMYELPVAALTDVHMMNTSGFIFGLYEAGLLPEGLELIDRINKLRRSPMEAMDTEARTKKIRSTWRRRIKNADPS